MTDYPAHIKAAAKALAEKHNWSLDCWGKSQVAALCEALTMETVPEPVDDMRAVARVRVANGGYSMSLATYVAYGLPEGDHWLYTAEPKPEHIAPIPTPVSEERIEEMAREVLADSCRRTSASPLDIIRAGIKRGLAERGEGA